MITGLKAWWKNTVDYWMVTKPDPKFDFSVYKDPQWRVITASGNFYVEQWIPRSWDKVNGGQWCKISMFNNGIINQDYSYERYFSPLIFDTVEDACSIMKQLVAGVRYFPEYDKIKFAVIDCDCLKTEENK